MKCPKCKDIELNPTKLDNELPAQGCSQCGGTLISLLYYRDWAERTIGEEDAANGEVAAVADSQSVLACPKCKKLMTKYLISGASKNKLDFCGNCDESWIDNGEWELLKSLQLSKKIPTVFTDAWQQRVLKEISESKHIERFSSIFSGEDLETAKAFREWIKNHPQKTEILFFVGKK